MNYEITFIGHMCYDEVTPFGGKPIVAPGSAVLCGAMVAAKVGKKVAAVVKMSPKDKSILNPMKNAGVDTFLISSGVTTYSKVVHESENMDERKITLVRTAGLMDKVKLDIVEAKVLTGTDDLEKAALIVEKWGCPEIMITHSQGVLVRVNGKTYYEKFSNNSVVGRTGRGDTTFAAYLSWRLEHNAAESLKFAAALVSIKMEAYGSFNGTLEAVMKRIREKHS